MNTTEISYVGGKGTTSVVIESASNTVVIGPTVQKIAVTSIGLGAVSLSHTNLLGLDRDDHPQYLTDERGDLKYSVLDHVHTEAEITDLDKYTKSEIDISQSAQDTVIADHIQDGDNPHNVTYSNIGGGIPSTAHAITTGQTPDDHHDQLHTTSHTAGGGDELPHDNLAGSGTNTHAQIDTLMAEPIMRWRGVWAAGTYVQYDTIFDEGWSFVANTTTTDKPAPHILNEAQFFLPTNPVWNTPTSGDRVFNSIKITVPEDSLVKATKYRFWSVSTSVDYTYIIWKVVSDGAGGNIFTQLINITGDSSTLGWNEIAIDSAFRYEGTEADLVLETINSSTSTVVTGGWIREGDSNNNEPATQQWNKDKNSNILRISVTDLDSANRQTELLGIVAGSTIRFIDTINNNKSVTYSILADPTLGTTAVLYEVVQSTQGPGGIPLVGDTTTMNSDTATPSITSYVTDPTGLAAYGSAQGGISLTGSYADMTYGVASYGIDIQIQPYSYSHDWDLLSPA